jgi:hypothetical protein
MAGNDLTAERLRELLHYDPETGVFTWLPRQREMFREARHHAIWNTRYSGKRAGHAGAALGYETISVIDRAYFSHRLAWLYVHGAWPLCEIDHINGVRTDNRIVNLRDVARGVNQQNIRKSLKSRELPLGVFFNTAQASASAASEFISATLTLQPRRTPRTSQQSGLTMPDVPSSWSGTDKP